MRLPTQCWAAAVTLLVSAAATGCAPTDRVQDERPLVLTTFTVLADMASEVAGGHLRVESVTKLGAEIHGYEPTPSDLRRGAGANLILEHGLGLEGWFAKFQATVESPSVLVTAEVDPVMIAGSDHANPHAWMSPVTAERYVEAMVAAFSELAPEHAADFRARADDYVAQLRAIHAELTEAVGTLPPQQRTLVTCEGAFSYLARDAGLAEVYLWPVNSDSGVTAQQIRAVIDRVERDQIPAVFCESTVSDAAMQQVVQATGARFGGVLYVDSLSEAGGPVPTYLDLLRYDIALIIAGLTGGTP